MTELLVILTVERTVLTVWNDEAANARPMRATIVRTMQQTDPRQTRAEVFTWAMEQVPEHVKGGAVMFFSAEPNMIGGQR